MTLRLLRATLFAASVVAWVLFVAVTARRIGHPLELGNLDGAFMDHIVRITRGLPLYVAPSLDFIPLAYMPLYPVLVAPLALLFGPAFWEGRLVSALAAVVVGLVIAWIVRRETRSRTLGVTAGGLFLMGQGLTHGIYDCLNVNTVFLAFAFGGLATLRFTRGTAGAVAAAALLTASFFTKQHGALFGLAALMHVALNDRTRFRVFAATLVTGCVGGFLLLSLWLGPWFRFYVWEVPSHWSQLGRVRLLDYFRADLLGAMSCLFLPALLSLARPPSPWRGRAAIWWWTAAGGIGTGLLATLDPYAYFHVLMPTLASLCVLGPVALRHLLAPRPAGGEVRVAAAWSTHGVSVACVALLLQFLALLYSPVQRYWPRTGGRAEAEAWKRELTALGRPVAIPFHGFYAYQAGRGTSMHILPLDDVLRARGNSLLVRDPGYFEREFAKLRSGPGRPVLITDAPLDSCGNLSRPLWASLGPGYRLAGTVGWLSNAMRELDGYRGAPTYVYVPVDPALGIVPAADSASASAGTPARAKSAAGPPRRS